MNMFVGFEINECGIFFTERPTLQIIQFQELVYCKFDAPEIFLLAFKFGVIVTKENKDVISWKTFIYSKRGFRKKNVYIE